MEFFQDNFPKLYWLFVAVPRRLYEPRSSFTGQENSGSVSRLAFIRSVAGSAFLIVFGLRYFGQRPVPDLYTDAGYPATTAVLSSIYRVTKAVEHWLEGIRTAFGVTVIVALVVLVILILLTKSGHRASLIGPMTVPFTTLLIAVVHGALGAAVVWASGRLLDIAGATGVIVGGLCLMVGLLIDVWLLVGVCILVYGLFRADDAHPLLGPLTAPISSWICAWIAYHSPADPSIPDGLARVFLIGGPITLTVVSLIVIGYLWRSDAANMPYLRGPTNSDRRPYLMNWFGSPDADI